MSSWQSLQTVESRTRTRNSLNSMRMKVSSFPNKPHQTCEDKTAEPDEVMYSRCGLCPPLLEMKGAACRCRRAVRVMFPAHPLTWASRFTLRLIHSLPGFELEQPGGWRAGPGFTLIMIITCDMIQIIQFIIMYSDKCAKLSTIMCIKDNYSNKTNTETALRN